MCCTMINHSQALFFSFMVSSLIAAFDISIRTAAAEKPMARSSDCHPLCCGRGAAEGIREALCGLQDEGPTTSPFPGQRSL